MSQAKRIANSDNEVADSCACRIANSHFGQAFGIYFDYRNIGRRVRANDFGIMNRTVDQRNLDCVSFTDDVMVGKNITTLSINDDTRPGTGNLLSTTAIMAIRQAEEATKCIVTEGITIGYGLADPDIDDGRRDLLYQWCEASDWLALNALRQGGSGRCQESQREEQGR